MTSTLKGISALASTIFSPTFTPAASCTQDIFLYDIKDAVSCVDESSNPASCQNLHLGPTTSTSDCFPPEWTPTMGYYESPGRCPEGYTFACVRSTGDEVETTATCCPSNYGCQTKPLFTQLSTELCTSSVQPTDSYIYTTFVDGEGPQALTRYGNPTNRVELVGAFGMEVRWQASDIADADKEKTGSGSSSTRVKVGIGVSVGMGVLLVIGVAALLLRTRREQKKQKLAAKSIQAGEAQDSEDKYLDDRETRAVDERPTELENLPSTLEMYVMPSEMRAVDERPVVVESSQLRHEMYVMPTEMGPGERYDRL